VIVVLGIFGWGILIPVFYTAFSDAVRQLARSGAFPEELLNFGSGSLFSLPGAVTLGTQHPMALAMLGIFAVGATATAIAGERQRGTLEVLLARPLSRTTVYLSMLAALLIVVGIVLAALLAGFLTGAATQGVIELLPLARCRWSSSTDSCCGAPSPHSAWPHRSASIVRDRRSG
jgi:ABC-2 type transport system permease protein